MSNVIHAVLQNPFAWWALLLILNVAFFASPYARMMERALCAPDPEEVDASPFEAEAGVEKTNPIREESVA